ncbi:uncharacterized protein F4807DRAFT_91589 [Annulohypoxylon truncatum]|uniref:uncharacterized protein n=1 Tax=Annulohypoxylon truncatum TaxID=327061 RepID=UPI002008280E|nr:uncharacterized protein F4807DRAFT_91589 [Annulohypoxylon truncatum]KAI1209371.1 hypothetical protein F4807DRAFT_91589 [Annulohypoxylon truncatum]
MSNRKYESFFSYSVSRPFPFRWFTPGAIIGGIVSLALFTFLNFASSGYNLVVQISSNPNATLSEGNWLQRWPSFLTAKVQPTCEPANLPVNSQIFTNQTALTYMLTNVWQHHEATGEQVASPSLSYYNNVLENCSVASIEMNLESMDRSANQFAYSEWGALLRSYATCQIATSSGVVFFNLTQTYEYVPSTVSYTDIGKFLGSGFLSRNQTTRASLWWGESLMSTYWGAVTWEMQQERENKTDNHEYGIRKGTVSFMLNGSFSDIKDLKYFNADYRFIVDKGGSYYDVISPGGLPMPVTAEFLNATSEYPNIWTKADTLAKSTYSTILTDLGQTTATPNILSDATLLTYFTSNISQIEMANFKAGPANESFDDLNATTGPLRVTPSVISTTYLCQVPELKSAGNLILAIIVADLVLMQGVWQLYKISAEWYLTRRQPTANYCQGCMIMSGGELSAPSESSATTEGDTENYPLVEVSNPSTRDSTVSMHAVEEGHPREIQSR